MFKMFWPKFHSYANSKAASMILLFSFFFIIAAAAHCGSMAKWGLRDAEARFSIAHMIDGTANKPFVYRQFLPFIGKWGQEILASPSAPKFVKDVVFYKINPGESFIKATSANLPGYEYSYRIIYIANFAALFLSLFLLRTLIIKCGGNGLESILAPSAFILAFPYVQTIGGYFYDSVELAFFSSAVLLALEARIIGLILLAGFATFNKESFFFFLPTLYPLLRLKLDQKKAYIGLAGAIFTSGVVNAYIKYSFQNNPGGPAEFQFFKNLKNYLHPTTYFQTETTYGVLGPKGMFAGTLVIIFIILIQGYSETAPAIKKHLLIGLIISAPLFITFCATGELRNLSMLFVGFVIMMSMAIKKIHVN